MLAVGTPVRTHPGRHRQIMQARGLVTDVQKVAGGGFRYVVAVPASEWNRAGVRPLGEEMYDTLRVYDDEVTALGPAPADLDEAFRQVYQLGTFDFDALVAYYVTIAYVVCPDCGHYAGLDDWKTGCGCPECGRTNVMSVSPAELAEVLRTVAPLLAGGIV